MISYDVLTHIRVEAQRRDEVVLVRKDQLDRGITDHPRHDSCGAGLSSSFDDIATE